MTYNTKHIEERINEAIAYLKGNRIVKLQKDIASKLKMNKSTVSQAIKGNERYLTESFVIKFCHAFDMISPDWILKGEGKMLKVEDEIEFSKGSIKVEKIVDIIIKNRDKFEKNPVFKNYLEGHKKDALIDYQEKLIIKSKEAQ